MPISGGCGRCGVVSCGQFGGNAVIGNVIGSGGLGAEIDGDFSLTAGEVQHRLAFIERVDGE